MSDKSDFIIAYKTNVYSQTWIGNNQIYLQPLDLDTVKQSIKISKQDLGELNENLFIALVLIIEKQPRVVYLIPSKELQDSNNDFL